jgi:hypothetical protein
MSDNHTDKTGDLRDAMPSQLAIAWSQVEERTHEVQSTQ